MAAVRKKLLSVDFEVFGKVQGVFFRKHTKETARKLKLVGWVKNTRSDTVKGTLVGPHDDVAKMKEWLAHKGSPKSHISKCDFKNEQELSSTSYSSFEVVRE